MKKTIAGISIGALLLGAIAASCGNAGQPGAGNAEQKEPVRVTATRDNGDGTSTSTVAEYPTTDTLDETLSQGMNQFSYTMAEHIAAENGGENYFFSPYSVCSALTLLDNAAGGETKTQMEKMLGISDLEQWNQQLSAYMRQEQPAEAVITSANSIWLDQDYVLKDDAYANYLPKMDFYYDVQLFQADFVNELEAAKEQIRAWIQDNTGDMISDYKPLATPDTVLELINAVYFYGEWSTPFVAAFTRPGNFMGLHGDTEVDMMHMSEVNMSYLEADGLRALSVPYGDGSKVMNIVLPSEDQMIEAAGTGDMIECTWSAKAAEIFQNLTTEEKNSFLNQLMNAETQPIMNFSLPKFDMTYSVTGMPEMLSTMGMVDAFDGGAADFSGLGDIYVSDIGHMAKLEVDELGSRASAVTEIMMDEGAAIIDNPIDFIVDQPFLFFIQDKETGIILFMGQVNDLD